MMRNIKFRGLNEKNKWSHGSLIVSETGLVAIVPEVKLFVDMPWKKLIMQSVHQVDPETIGQFVGLKDKNGVEIYEGDILQDKVEVFDIRIVEQLKWYECDAFIEYGYHNLGSFIREYSGKETSEFIKNCEVIGNAYQNPELLKD